MSVLRRLGDFHVCFRRSEPFIEKIDLFQAGQGGYAVYHIPGIVVTAKGSVLAWCEARKKGGDWDDIRILLRRSTDEGKTWSEPKSIADVPGPKTKNPFSLGVKGVNPEDVTYNNPVLIADRDGTVHCLFCLEYMRCFYMRSADDGVTWSAPVEITAAFEDFHKILCVEGSRHWPRPRHPTQERAARRARLAFHRHRRKCASSICHRDHLQR